MKNFNRRNFHGHHGSKRREPAQHARPHCFNCLTASCPPAGTVLAGTENSRRWGEGEACSLYPKPQCHHWPSRFRIQTASAVSDTHCGFTTQCGRAKSRGPIHHNCFKKRKVSRSGFEPGSVCFTRRECSYHVPLDQTGSRLVRKGLHAKLGHHRPILLPSFVYV